jgi:hypothetical protein
VARTYGRIPVKTFIRIGVRLSLIAKDLYACCHDRAEASSKRTGKRLAGTGLAGLAGLLLPVLSLPRLHGHPDRRVASASNWSDWRRTARSVYACLLCLAYVSRKRGKRITQTRHNDRNTFCNPSEQIPLTSGPMRYGHSIILPYTTIHARKALDISFQA